MALFGIGLLGEYVGRIYAQVRERPRYLVEAVFGARRGAQQRNARVGHGASGYGSAVGDQRPSFLHTARSAFAVCASYLAQGINIPLLFTHADDPNEKQWFGSVIEVAQASRA